MQILTQNNKNRSNKKRNAFLKTFCLPAFNTHQSKMALELTKIITNDKIKFLNNNKAYLIDILRRTSKSLKNKEHYL